MSTITLRVSLDDTRLDLTLDEARALRDALDRALGPRFAVPVPLYPSPVPWPGVTCGTRGETGA